jgi:hypothetical protein
MNDEPFVVLFDQSTPERPVSIPGHDIVHAATSDDAESVFEDRHPGTPVLWIVPGTNVEAAFHDYWNHGLDSDEPVPDDDELHTTTRKAPIMR